MSQNELTESKENDMDALKSRLSEFIDRAAITQFEGDDLIQLLEEGESIDWIVEQLKGNSPAVNVDEAAALLTSIKKLLSPETGSQPAEAEAGVAEIFEPPTGEPDLSQVDLSQIAEMLPPGVKLPPGLDMKELKGVMESAQGKIMADFLLFLQERGIEPNERMFDDPRIQKLHRAWQSTSREAFDGKTPAEMMEGSLGLMPEKVETFRRAEPHVGRNDPCPCGSGKKYKKCCGRA
jgi:uncharacterized protein YecA (UPF0149 family)